MALLNSCCFFKSLRSGCMVSGVYTLVFYTLVLTASTFHIHEVLNNREKLIFTIIMIIFSITIILSSIILLIGVHADNRPLLVPWLLTVTITTLTDIIFTIYIIIYKDTDPFLVALHGIDFVVCTLNTYCLLCVISQYQSLSNQTQRHQEFGSNMVSEDAKIQCITNETSSCQFSNSANKDAANSTYGDF